MARDVRRMVRGNRAQVAAYTGPSGEPVWNTDDKRVHVQDGGTPGGSLLAPERVDGGRVDYTFPTLAAAQLARIPTDQQTVTVAGNAAVGTGRLTLKRSAVQAPGGGRYPFLDGTYWEPINPGILSLEQLGALSGNPTSFITALQTARLMGLTVVRWDGKVSGVVTPANYDLFFNVSITGSGDVEGLDRKNVSGDLSLPAMPSIAGDTIASEHFYWSCKMPFSNVVVAGDSNATFRANTHARQCMFSAVFQRTLQEQATSTGRVLNYFNRSIGGQGIAALFDKPVFAPGRVIDWYTDTTRAWLAYIKDCQPTLLVIPLGINDGNISVTALRSIETEVRSWRFGTGTEVWGTDICFVTNLVPRPMAGPGSPSDGSWATKQTQDTADQAAGLIRSFAKKNRCAVLDMHRMICRARDGFDPVIGTIRKVRDVALVTGGGTGTQDAINYQVRWRLDPTKLATNGSTPIVIRHGAGDADVINIKATATSNAYEVLQTSGNGADLLTVSGPTNVLITPPADQPFELVFEKTGTLGMLYIEGLKFENGYGEATPPLWVNMLVGRGGKFRPSIVCSAAGALSNIAFDYGIPAVCKPTISADKLFGTTPIGTSDPATNPTRDGGDGFKHPTSYIETHIYAPVIEATQFYAADPFRQKSTRTATFRDSTGYDRRFGFEAAGFTAYDGYLAAQGGLRVDPANPATRFYRSGSGNIGAAAGVTTDAAYWEWRASTGVFAGLNGGFSAFGPYLFAADNAFTVGTAAQRAKTIFSVDPVINTSDAREKLDRDGAELVENKVSPLTDAEVAWACALGDEVGVYRWKASYAEKGKDARLHVGMTVQRAITLAAEHGIADPMAYGFICLDTWEAEEPQDAVTEEVEVTDASGELLLDKDGKPVMRTVMHRPATPGHPAGDRYGFRGEELEMFIRAGERAAARKARSAA